MGDQPLELHDLEILRIGLIRHTQNGHPFLEAESSEGVVVAFWGYSDETSNITALQEATLPVVARCQVRTPSQIGRHDIWVPWSSPLFLSSADTTMDASVEAFDEGEARAEVSRLGRVLTSILDRVEGKVSDEGFVPRILRLSRDERIVPRRISAFMILVAEMRNSAEHDRHPFTELQTDTARTAWRAITEWLQEAFPDE